MSKRLYLIDGNNYLFRAFFAIRGLSRSDGLPTNAVYGFTAMLIKLLRDEKPDYLAVTFDASSHTFRNDLYPAYKAQRPPMPEDLVPQLPIVREVVRAFQIPVVEQIGWEADDLIASLTTRARAAGMETTLVSSDKDLYQLVGPGCTLLDTMKGVRFGPDEVRTKMGVGPDQIVDLLALMGDSVDNIPGVPGIGAKTAAALLCAHGSLDGVYASIATDTRTIKGKRREMLIAHEGDARMSQTLATVRRDVPVRFEIEELAVAEPDPAILGELFGRLEFRTWHNEYSKAVEKEAPRSNLSRDGYMIVTDALGLAALRTALRRAKRIAFDTETTGLDTISAELVGLSFAVDEARAWYVPVGHRGEGAAQQLAKAEVIAVLRDVLEDPTRPKAAQNAKFDLQILHQAGVDVQGLDFDPMLASWLLDPGARSHGLDALAERWLGHRNIHFSEVTADLGDDANFSDVPLLAARDYACEDAQVAWVLCARLEAELEAQGLAGLLRDLELPLVAALAEMELAGVRVDAELLGRLSADLGERAGLLEARCHEVAGTEFAVGSPKQLGEVLFDRLGLASKKRTKTGRSTDSSVLEDLATEHELPQLVLDWRSVTKLKSTYTDVLPTLIHPVTGRIHGTFHQTGTATGRLSSSDPNLQNIPVRSDDGRRIREAFVAAPGHLLLAADYSQIDLRVLAHLCGDAQMVQAFVDRADIHARTAALLFNVDEADVSRDQRGVAKTVNFGILYGMSAHRLGREQGMTHKEAQALIDRYFARYPAIEAWKEQTLADGRKEGVVRTLMGRIRRVPDLNASSHMARAAAERIAVNTPVQGGSADIIKVAMARIRDRLRDSELAARMILQVHDELVFEVAEADVEGLRALVLTEMEGAASLRVPLVVSASAARDWLGAH